LTPFWSNESIRRKMREITKTQVEYLKKKKFIKVEQGRFTNLHIVSKNKKSNRKTYYTLDKFVKILEKRKIV
jgi:hypothetical protein